METLEEICAEVAKIYRYYLPARLAGLSPAEQEDDTPPNSCVLPE